MSGNSKQRGLIAEVMGLTRTNHFLFMKAKKKKDGEWTLSGDNILQLVHKLEISMPTVGIWGDRHPVTRFLYSVDDLPRKQKQMFQDM
jgi:hypothetical protein